MYKQNKVITGLWQLRLDHFMELHCSLSQLWTPTTQTGVLNQLWSANGLDIEACHRFWSMSAIRSPSTYPCLSASFLSPTASLKGPTHWSSWNLGARNEARCLAHPYELWSTPTIGPLLCPRWLQVYSPSLFVLFQGNLCTAYKFSSLPTQILYG